MVPAIPFKLVRLPSELPFVSGIASHATLRSLWCVLLYVLLYRVYVCAAFIWKL